MCQAAEVASTWVVDHMLAADHRLAVQHNLHTGVAYNVDKCSLGCSTGLVALEASLLSLAIARMHSTLQMNSRTKWWQGSRVFGIVGGMQEQRNMMESMPLERVEKQRVGPEQG